MWVRAETLAKAASLRKARKMISNSRNKLHSSSFNTCQNYRRLQKRNKKKIERPRWEVVRIIHLLEIINFKRSVLTSCFSQQHRRPSIITCLEIVFQPIKILPSAIQVEKHKDRNILSCKRPWRHKLTPEQLKNERTQPAWTFQRDKKLK